DSAPSTRKSCAAVKPPTRSVTWSRSFRVILGAIMLSTHWRRFSRMPRRSRSASSKAFSSASMSASRSRETMGSFFGAARPVSECMTFLLDGHLALNLDEPGRSLGLRATRWLIRAHLVGERGDLRVEVRVAPRVELGALALKELEPLPVE